MQIAPLPTRPPWSRGMLVPPEQIAESGKRHPELGRLRLVVTREADVITLKAECTSPNDALQDQLAASLRAVTKLGGAVELVPSGSLPRRQSNFATHGRWPEGYPSTGLRPAPVDEYEQPLSRGDDEGRRRSPTPSVGHNLQYCKPMERREKTGFVLQKTN